MCGKCMPTPAHIRGGGCPSWRTAWARPAWPSMHMNYSLATGVTVTQKDIRMLQLGKSAVCAGIRTLLEAAGLTPEALTELSVAGGFGTYLDIRNAAAIGLYPAELEGKTRVLGNAALAGAAMLLLAEPYVQKSCALAQQAETVDLSTSAAFMAHYVDCMEF